MLTCKVQFWRYKKHNTAITSLTNNWEAVKWDFRQRHFLNEATNYKHKTQLK